MVALAKFGSIWEGQNRVIHFLIFRTFDLRYHVLTHVQPGAVVNEDNKLESWIEFGVKLDKKHLQLPGRKQVLIVKFDKEKDEFIYEDTEFRSGIVKAEELSEKIQDHILRQQACVLKHVKSFDEVIKMQDKVVF